MVTHNQLLDLIVALTNNIAAIEEALGTFDAIADRADDANAVGMGAGLRCIQSVAVDSMIVGVGKLVDRGRQSLSFTRLQRTLRDTELKDPKPLAEWLEDQGRTDVASSSPDAVKALFLKEFYGSLVKSSRRVETLRHKFIAHREVGAKWETVGATFGEIEVILDLTYKVIDATAAAFLGFDSATEDTRKATRRRIAGIRKVIDRALQPEHAAA